jgi:glutamate formiminotransferase / formiminotetrahydrofolate cyclodeaminase
MPDPLVECVANYSEARRPEVVEAIIQSIRSVNRVELLDRHSDPDHNRTVLTFVGPPGAIEEAAFRSIAKAATLIDLDRHTGQHPRIGATDVVPFVPISDVTMQDCIEIARRLGKRVGDNLGIPVYLYEEAATSSERRNLENIRRGQYEALKEEIETRPERAPDFGPLRVGSAGATVIGARHPLIAYNVYLTTGDVSIAKKIAKAIRFSSGGLRYVKALGLLVEGRAQVSMNLTNYRETPVAQVVEMIRREAQRFGVGVHHSELVGLIPEEALRNASVWYLQLDQFEPEQVLERRLASIRSRNETARSTDVNFLESLAAGTPTPGGGSAAAYAGAMGAALAAMTAHLTVGKKKYAPVEAEMQNLIDEADRIRTELVEAVQRDAEAFDAVIAALRLPQDTPDEQQARRQAVEDATLKATQEPLGVAQKVVRVMELALCVAQKGNANAATDSASGFLLARAALQAAGMNVRVNLKSLEESTVIQGISKELNTLESRAAGLEEELHLALRERASLELWPGYIYPSEQSKPDPFSTNHHE